MSDHLGVRPGDLVAHARTVEAIAGRVDAATRAGAAARAGAEAYGKLCVMVPALLNAVGDTVVHGIEVAADSLRDGGSRLRATATDYAEGDARNASAVRLAGTRSVTVASDEAGSRAGSHRGGGRAAGSVGSD